MGNKKLRARKRVKLFIFIYLLGISFVLLSHFNFGSNYGIHYINNYLIKKVGYKIEMADFASNINSYMDVNDFLFSDIDSVFCIKVDSVNVEYSGLIKLFARKHIDFIKLKHPTITINLYKLNKNSNSRYPKINLEKIIVDSAQINIIVEKKDTVKFVNFCSQLSFYSNGKSVAIPIDKSSFYQNKIERDVEKLSADILIKNDILKFKNLLYRDNDFNIESTGKVKTTLPNQFKMSVVVDRIKPDSLLNISDSLFFKNDILNVSANLSGNREKVSAIMKITGIFRSEIIDNFDAEIRYANKKIDIYSMSFVNDYLNINLFGEYKFNKKYNLKINLKESYPKFFGIETDSLNISGKINANGDMNKVNFIDYDIHCANMLGGDIPKIIGKIEISKNQITILDTSKIFFEDGIAKIHGEIIDGNLLNIYTDIHMNSLKNMPLLNEYDLQTTSIIHRNHISGSIKKPNFSGRFYAENIAYDDYHFGSMNFIVNLKDIVNREHGEIYLNISEIVKGKIKIKSAESLMVLEKDTIKFDFIELRGEKGYMELAGKLKGFNKFNITDIYVEHSGNEIFSQKPFNINYENDELSVTPFKFKINDGEISGKLNLKKNKDVFSNLLLENIKVGNIFKTSDINFPASGELNGIIDIAGNLNNPQIETTIKTKNVKIKDYNYDKLDFNIKYEDSTVFISDFKLEDDNHKTISIFGDFPLYLTFDKFKYDFINSQKINLDVIFNDIDLMKYDKLFMDKLLIGGKMTGVLTIGGYFNKPTIKFPIRIENPKIGKSKFNSGIANITYSEGKLSINNAKIKSENGNYYGYGYIPISLNLEKNKNFFNKDDSLYFTVAGKDKNLSYLSPFIDNIEKVNGEINTSLTLTGTFNNPNRNGSVIVKDSRMTIRELKNDVTNINGEFIINDNIMILNANAYMYKQENTIMSILGLEKNKQSKELSNLYIEGNLDMEDFFKPKFDINIRGENINIATLTDEVDIIGDLRMAVKGKDTVFAEGKFQTKDGILRIPFGGETRKITQKNDNKRADFEYEIDIPIEKNIYLKNNFVDVELDGEVVMKKDANGNESISGEVDIIDGFFYYLTFIFDVESGKIIFDPVDGNHSLNFRATKETSDGNLIIAMLTGNVESPEIRLYDENNIRTQAEIVRILTLGNASSIGKSVVNVASGLTESVIEKNANSKIDFVQTVDLRTGETLDMDSTSIKIGSRLGKNIYLTIESTNWDNLRNEPFKSLELEYRINRKLSIVGKADDKSASGAVRLRFQY
ncbi:MAG: translocation/assembly module TamB domain-containing protein [Candidatus Marinimicrobia bacterium]|nr:translocation/assembly module TamB domain-containing protein [Candidatus Neomarinimicrobiota bacterium]